MFVWTSHRCDALPKKNRQWLSSKESQLSLHKVATAKKRVCGAACDLPGDEIYNPTTGKISSISHAGAPPSSHAATVLKDGRVLVTGGAAKADGTKAVVFDPAGGGIWTTLPAFKFDRELHTATLLPDGSVLLVGGRSGAGSSAKPASKAERLHHP